MNTYDPSIELLQCTRGHSGFMAQKPCLVLGKFTPFGKEFLGDSPAGTYRLGPVELDGIIAEEEFYTASDGRVVWSSGRQVVRGFDSVFNTPPASTRKVDSRKVHPFRCSFSQLTTLSSNPEGCLALLSPQHLCVYPAGGDTFTCQIPGRALHAWATVDGVLLLVATQEGTEHVVSLVGHPLNLPRSVSYVEVGANSGAGSVFKDSLRGKGLVHLRWVCQDLPLAVGYVPDQRRHSIFLLRRRPRADLVAAEIGGKAGRDVEAAAIEMAPSEVFLQCLHTLEAEGPSCELDDVALLAPDSEFPGVPRDGQEHCSLLLALYVRQTQRLTLVRLWSYEVVAVFEGVRAWAALLPGLDMRLRHGNSSGLAGRPSRWLGTNLCRVVLDESLGPALPTEPPPQILVLQLLLRRPLRLRELVRCSAVLCFDRHKLPQYLVTLDEASRTLHLFWGTRHLSEVGLHDPCESADFCPPSRPACIMDAIANRFTLLCEDRLLMSLATFCPSKELVETITCDVQVWCVQTGAGRRLPCDEDAEEWLHFCDLIFCLLEEGLSGGTSSKSPPWKRRKGAATPLTEDPSHSDDWEWLLGSAMHARERHNPRLGGLSASQEFVVPAEIRPNLPGSDAGEVKAPPNRAPDRWEGTAATEPKVLLNYMDDVLMLFHLLYEEWKLHTLHARLLPSLALFLHGLALRLGLPRFAEHYAEDYPAVRDPALATASFGGYGAWLWQTYQPDDGGMRIVADAERMFLITYMECFYFGTLAYDASQGRAKNISTQTMVALTASLALSTLNLPKVFVGCLLGSLASWQVAKDSQADGEDDLRVPGVPQKASKAVVYVGAVVMGILSLLISCRFSPTELQNFIAADFQSPVCTFQNFLHAFALLPQLVLCRRQGFVSPAGVRFLFLLGTKHLYEFISDAYVSYKHYLRGRLSFHEFSFMFGDFVAAVILLDFLYLVLVDERSVQLLLGSKVQALATCQAELNLCQHNLDAATAEQKRLATRNEELQKANDNLASQYQGMLQAMGPLTQSSQDASQWKSAWYASEEARRSLQTQLEEQSTKHAAQMESMAREIKDNAEERRASLIRTHEMELRDPEAPFQQEEKKPATRFAGLSSLLAAASTSLAEPRNQQLAVFAVSAAALAMVAVSMGLINVYACIAAAVLFGAYRVFHSLQDAKFQLPSKGDKCCN
ncbi:hypothetical protein AK812_SmicGene344 [Symbiodinium microadriaticum]|uniref:Uncharacterized protein n=1 Tax=Symbiodinium microadriaticum TaxID=2951 RepID=A0A1Q9F6Z7_SYMMI|nr:hypothetical protein AK812_SmicGene344 [Symbiodinium microadriaticum]